MPQEQIKAAQPQQSLGRSEQAYEAEAIQARYARRATQDARYSRSRADVQQLLLEREQAMRELLTVAFAQPWPTLKFLELGCGSGGNLADLLALGFAAEHGTGLELLPERLALAQAALPPSVRLLAGDALNAPIAHASQDLVLQFTVFTSVLNPQVQHELAAAMWAWLKPGGAVLWYDFTVDNPRNADVRGVPLARVRELFPGGEFRAKRVTLAPPLARAVCRVHPRLYGVFNALPWLRTHALVLIRKSAAG